MSFGVQGSPGIQCCHLLLLFLFVYTSASRGWNIWDVNKITFTLRQSCSSGCSHDEPVTPPYVPPCFERTSGGTSLATIGVHSVDLTAAVKPGGSYKCQLICTVANIVRNQLRVFIWRSRPRDFTRHPDVGLPPCLVSTPYIEWTSVSRPDKPLYFNLFQSSAASVKISLIDHRNGPRILKICSGSHSSLPVLF